MVDFKIILRFPNFQFKTNLSLIRRLPLCVLFSILIGQDNSSGLRFFGKDGLGGNTPFSTLDISSNDPIHVEDEFTLSFQFLIRDPSPFGFILHIDSDSLPASNLVNIDFKHIDTTYFEFSFQEINKMISISIPKSELNPLKWHHLSITYNLVLDEVRLVLNNKVAKILKYPMLNEQDIRIKFGSNGLLSDVPSMTLKNIKVFSKNVLRHHWKFDESSGNYGYDNIGGRKAMITNSLWEYESHITWVVEDTIIYKDPEIIIFSNDHNNITFIENGLNIYTIDTHEYSKKFVRAKINIEEDGYFYYNNINEKIFVFSSDGGDFNLYDLNKNIKKSYLIEGPRDQYHMAGHFFDFNTNEFYLFGGYGWYRSKNHIRKFDYETHHWDTLSVWGDRFYPRFGSSVSEGPDSNYIYLFGGSGNISGLQERGFHTFNDFWKFNRKTMHLQKIKSFISIQHYDQAVLSYSKDINRFLLSVKSISNSPIYILTINPETYDIENKSIIPNTETEFQLRKIVPNVNKKTGKLVVATQSNISNTQKTFVQIHTINYPPMDPPPISAMESWGRYGFGVLALMISLGIIGFRWKNNKINDIPSSTFIYMPSFSQDENPYLHHDFAVQCFGNFKLYKSGIEVLASEWISKKARHLFVYLILNGDKGVSPNDIYGEFWPNTNQKSAANSRYVAMSQIRNVLGAAYSGIINSFDHNIFIKLGAEHFSDFHYFLSVFKANSQADIQARETALRLYGSGELCHDVDDKWMEDIRQNIQAKSKRIAESLVIPYRELNNWQKLAALGEQILSWDSIDEDGLQWAMEGHLKNQHTAKAKSVFDIYTRHYNDILDNQPELNFKDIEARFV